MYRIFFRWRWLTIFQQFPSVLTLCISTVKIFAKAPSLQLHIMATAVTFQDRTIVAFNSELTQFNHVAITGWVITAHMQFTLLVNQIAIHGSTTLRAAFFSP